MALLRAAATEATQIRDLQTKPEVVALRVERIATQVQRLMWAGILLGLGFTMANVQEFAAGDAPRYSLMWWTAWLLDPMVSLVLIAILIAEQTIARYQVLPGSWVRRAKWSTLAATYTMNTWSAWEAVDLRLIMLHSIPPLAVFVGAEAVTDLRYKLTETIERAAHGCPPLHTAVAGAAPEPAATASAYRPIVAVSTPADTEPATVPIPRFTPPPAAPSSSSGAGPLPGAIRTEPEPEQRGNGGGDASDTGERSQESSEPAVSNAQVDLIAQWLASGEELDGAAVAGRIGASPRTGKPVSARQGRRLLQRASELVDARARSHGAAQGQAPAGATDRPVDVGRSG